MDGEQTAMEWRKYLSREYAYVAIGIITIGCISGIVLAPELSTIFFICIFGVVYIALLLHLGAFSAKLPESRLGTHAGFAGRDTMILQSMAEAFQHPVFILDQNAHVKSVNRNAQSTFGVMKSDEWLFLKFRQPELRRTIEEGLRSGEPRTASYNETVSKRRWFSVELAPIPSDKPGKYKLFILAFHDLTEMKRTDQMRSDFIANASHELRTPLASLLGYLETIKGPARKDPKALDRFTDVMLDQAQRMTRLVNDLLSLSRIEMKSHVSPSEAVNLSEIVNSVVVSLEGVAKQLGVKISFECSQTVIVKGDRDELLQVFENLIENACKYGQDGKKVDVSLKTEEKKSEKFAIVSVRDYGPGIALEDQHRITERFYRVDVEQSREKQGTGLGLAIVKHILNRHNTRLNISSRPGEGAEFSVRLQVAENV